MTEITRVFHAETRAITNVARRYCGQANDSLSTTLHFEYDPIDFITSGGYTPYIMFAIYDEHGNPLVYGPQSTPRFDGHTFPIPWEVTHMVKTQRVEYQLYFTRNNVSFKGSVAHLDSTEYVQSAVDGFALKPSISCKRQDPSCPPMAPSTEPTVAGYINLFKEYGLVMPVDLEENVGEGRLSLTFHTYNERTQRLDLHVPFLDEDGKIPKANLRLVSTWDGMTSDDDIPTAKMVHDHIEGTYTPKVMSVAVWDSNTLYTYKSTVVYGSSLYISLMDENIGHQPDLATGWWSVITGGSSESTAMTASVAFGDSTSYEYDVTHNLGTLDVLWSIRTNDADRRFVKAGVSVKDLNTLTVKVNTPPGGGMLTLNVIGIGAIGTTTAPTKTIIFGNASDKRYVLTHGFNSNDYVWSLRTNDADRRFVDADAYATDLNTLTLYVNDPPGDNMLVVSFIRTGRAAPPEPVEPHAETETFERSVTWSHNNNTGTAQFVQCYQTNGKSFAGVLKQDASKDFTPIISKASIPLEGSMVMSTAASSYPFEEQSTFTITHGLDMMMLVQVYVDNTKVSYCQVSQDGNKVIVEATVPLSGYVVLAGATIDVEVQSNSVWSYTHNFGRMAGVQTFDETGDEIIGVVESTTTSVTVTFSEPKSGRLLLL